MKGLLNEVEKGLGYEGWKIIAYVVVIILISFYSYLFMIMAGMSIGQTFQDKRVLWSVVFSVVLYYVSQIVSTVFMLVFSFGVMDMDSLIKADTNPTGFINYSVAIGLGLSLVFTVAYYVIARWNLKRKLNLI